MTFFSQSSRKAWQHEHRAWMRPKSSPSFATAAASAASANRPAAAYSSAFRLPFGSRAMNLCSKQQMPTLCLSLMCAQWHVAAVVRGDQRTTCSPQLVAQMTNACKCTTMQSSNASCWPAFGVRSSSVRLWRSGRLLPPHSSRRNPRNRFHLLVSVTKIKKIHLATTPAGALLARAAAMKGSRPTGDLRSEANASSASHCCSAASVRICRSGNTVNSVIHHVFRANSRKCARRQAHPDPLTTLRRQRADLQHGLASFLCSLCKFGSPGSVAASALRGAYIQSLSLLLSGQCANPKSAD